MLSASMRSLVRARDIFIREYGEGDRDAQLAKEALAELGDPSSGVQGARLFRDVFADDPQAPEDQQILPEDRWSVPGGSLAVGAHQQVNRRPRVNSPTYAHALPVRTSVGSSSSSTLLASHGTPEKTRGHLKPLASTVCPRHRVGGLVSFCADDTSTQFSTLAPTYRTVCARSLRAGSSGAEGLSRTAPLAVGACHVQR